MASSDPGTPTPRRASTPGSHGRVYTLYDAVAGHVRANSPRPPSPTKSTSKSKYRAPPTPTHPHSAHDPRLAPEDVLFRHRRAPTRYEEDDFYWAHEDLPPHALPPSDLLKSVHKYASTFYEAMATRLGPQGFVKNRTIDERSMDETALLAFGVLLEEAGREVLRGRGDLVFVEGEEAVDGKSGERERDRHGRLPKRRKITSEEYVEREGR
ncbi:hypothetical protein QBC34DRAFT_179580 [Podospora aff. communis PSN243]|uniref:Uncharacterized protein n=1 Tax=Podospora aff. communis PSN243 TaxID=3040156 RepID=A0AAV9GCG9_9PEZI|nr:hypothetical protein QBC34DRAFT_179580 [Podospora aff. communis PSN243]